MANDEYREQHERDRARGLVARQETRQERAVRRQVAEEIAAAIESYRDTPETLAVFQQIKRSSYGYMTDCAELAREIGSREATE